MIVNKHAKSVSRIKSEYRRHRDKMVVAQELIKMEYKMMRATHIRGT